MASEIHCCKIGCYGIINLRDPEHIKRGNLYFCDTDCEADYDRRQTAGDITTTEDFMNLLFPGEELVSKSH